LASKRLSLAYHLAAQEEVTISQLAAKVHRSQTTTTAYLLKHPLEFTRYKEGRTVRVRSAYFVAKRNSAN
jgi:hypothetical protein